MFYNTFFVVCLIFLHKGALFAYQPSSNGSQGWGQSKWSDKYILWGVGWTPGGEDEKKTEPNVIYSFFPGSLLDVCVWQWSKYCRSSGAQYNLHLWHSLTLHPQAPPPPPPPLYLGEADLCDLCSDPDTVENPHLNQICCCFVCLTVCLSNCLSVTVCLSVSLFVCLTVCLSNCLNLKITVATSHQQMEIYIHV